MLLCLLAGWLLIGCAAAPTGQNVHRVAGWFSPTEPVVQLRAAQIPLAPAVHLWFVEFAPGRGGWHRWEVWHVKDEPWGHIRRDRASPTSGVTFGGSWVVQEWLGADAEALHQALNEPQDYPFRDVYAALPGPNSTTYVKWVLQRAGVPFRLPPGAVGIDPDQASLLPMPR